MTSMIRRGALTGAGPKTLSRGQFQAKRPAGDYSKYLAFVNKRRSSSLGQAAADPLAATSPGSIDQTVNRFTGMYGAPMNDASIQTAAQAQIDPIVAAITGNINARAKTSSDQIAANSAALAKDLGTTDYAAPYLTAQVDQANVDAVLQAALAGKGGTDLAGDLSSRLSIIDDPAVASTASALADRGASLGTTELAHGTTNLGQLIAEAANAKAYGLKMPGIARQSGLQDIAGVNKQAVTDIGNATTQAEQQLPTIVGNLRNSRDAVAANRAQAAAQIYETLTGQNITKATAEAGLLGDQAKLQATTASMPDATLSGKYGYAVDQYGNPVGGKTTPLPGYHVDPKSGAVVKDGKTAAPKPLTTADRRAAVQDIDTYYYGVAPKQHYDSIKGWIDVPGTGVPAVDYPTAVRNLMDAYGMTQAQAESLANTRYKAGEDGRPKTKQQVATEKKQAALVPAGKAAITLPTSILTGGR